MRESILDKMREFSGLPKGLEEEQKRSIELVFMSGVSSAVAMLYTSPDMVGQLGEISRDVHAYLDGLNKPVVVTDEQDE